jgi:succinyl-CoA synthetase beta subunit
MEITGMLYGARLLDYVEFPAAEVLGPDATEDDIQGLIDRHNLIFIKPLFRGGVGKKGKSGLIGKATDLKTALKEKDRLYFVEHRHGNAAAKANGVTFEGGVPAEHEVYFAITDSTEFRAPAMTLTHRGGMDIEELDKSDIAQVPFEALTGLKAFVVANALTDIGAPKEIISPLVQHLPKLWELVHHYGMTTLELNPIRMRPGRDGRLTPVACDFKCGFDRDDPRWQRLGLPNLTISSRPIRQTSSTRSTSCAPIRVNLTFSLSTRMGRSWRPPSVAAQIRWSPRCSAKPRSFLRISAVIRPTKR